MSLQPLYRVQHINLRQSLTYPSSEKQYFVFWWNEIPLGHYYKEDSSTNTDEWERLVWKTIKPTIEYYCSKQRIDILILQEIFLEKDQKSIQSAFNNLFYSYTIKPENNLPSVSLVICTRNRANLLEKCLNSLSQLNYKASEIIVVDNAPDDDSTKKLVANYPEVRYVKEERKGLDYARNCGVNVAKFDIVAFTDDDVDLHPDWVWRFAESFADYKVQAVTGIVFAKALDTKSQYYFEKYWSFNRGYRPVCFDKAYFDSNAEKGVPVWEIGAGASMAFRRSIFETLGGFDVRLDMGAAGCNGDSEMWYRILAEDWTIKYNPLVIAHHTHRSDIRAFKIQIHQYMRGFTTAVLIEHKRYKNKGELNHLFRTLPIYYLKRLRHIFKEENITLWQEIKGYIAGLTYYQKNKNKQPFDLNYNKQFLSINKEEQPLISIVITSYNHAHYLPEALNSVFGQTYKNIECIVVDDGSTDNTRALMQRYNNANYIYQENSGLAAARNKGATVCKGEFIIFLDADDYLYPDAAATQLRAFSQHPDAAFVAGSHDKINDQRSILSFEESPLPDDPYTALLHGNFIGMHAAVMYRKEIFDYFLFDTRLKACEDYDFYLRVARLFKIAAHSRKIAAYRIHGNNMSTDINLMLQQVKKVLQKQYDTLPIKSKYPYYKKGIMIWERYYISEARKK
ncbi:MAG TPA: glycosyltransferase [Flavipsychrobacter sp.]|nr:glycosyltransferase [Flavipsychrobacter sp.]